MIIAILSDIHGNYSAFLRVLEELKREKVDKLLILGDLVGYYYHPDKILQDLEKWDYLFIRGNHEEILKKMLDGEIDRELIKRKYGSGHDLAFKKLNSWQINKLVHSPNQLLIEIEGLKILMNHGSPHDPHFYIYPDAAKKILDTACNVNADIVLIGHSHYQFIHIGKKSILLNPGSVGQSRSTGGVADWAIINTNNNVIQLRSTFYDTSSLVNEIQKTDPGNTYLINILNRNRT